MLTLSGEPPESGALLAKRIYLVDTENVHSTWKSLLPVLTKNDRMLLFYTANSPYISYADLKEILSYPDSFEMIECYTGSNGLDFQLVSYMGYLLKTAAKTEYVILSNDTGYDAAIKFWRDRERVVLRMTTAELTKLGHQTTSVPEPAPQPAAEQPNPQQPRTRRRKRPSRPEESAPPSQTPAAPAAEAPAPQSGPEVVKKESADRRKGQNQPPKALPPHKEPEASQPKPDAPEGGMSPTVPVPEESPVAEEKLAILRETLTEIGDEKLLWIYHMLGQFSPRKLALIHVQLVKQYGQDEGTEYYKLLKPVLRKFYARPPKK